MIKAILAAPDLLKQGTLDLPNVEVLVERDRYRIVKVDGRINLLFKGSKGLKDWLQNFIAGFKVSEGGFPKPWYDVAVAAMSDCVNLDCTPDYAIGYSRGGAEALIFSFYYNILAVAISPPRVNKKVVYWEVPPIIVCSMNDLVRQVPLGFFFPGASFMIVTATGGHLLHPKKYDPQVIYSVLSLQHYEKYRKATKTSYGEKNTK